MRVPALLRLLIAVFLLLSASARADVLVLVHGWAAGADTWLHSGVMAALEASGWADAGVLGAGPAGIDYLPGPGAAARNEFYRVQLPAQAPLLWQAAQLDAGLRLVRERHPGARLTLVGHSAGGVVARLAMVRPGAPRVDRLITIASPNLGTTRAIEGLEVVDAKPFFCPGPGIDFLKSMFGGAGYDYLKHSRGALVDLTPAVPGSLIDWLNRQPHPDAEYIAVVRQSPTYAGDELVPALSQDLNQVPALHGRVRVVVTPTGHALTPADGTLLVRLLNEE